MYRPASCSHPPLSFCLRPLCPHLWPAPSVLGSKQGPNCPQLAWLRPIILPLPTPGPAGAQPQPHQGQPTVCWLCDVATDDHSLPFGPCELHLGRPQTGQSPRVRARAARTSRWDPARNASHRGHAAARDPLAFGHLGVVMFFAKWLLCVEVHSLWTPPCRASCLHSCPGGLPAPTCRNSAPGWPNANTPASCWAEPLCSGC